jgi:hypothetical protein
VYAAKYKVYRSIFIRVIEAELLVKKRVPFG